MKHHVLKGIASRLANLLESTEVMGRLYGIDQLNAWASR